MEQVEDLDFFDSGESIPKDHEWTTKVRMKDIVVLKERGRNNFDSSKVLSLADSIKTNGLLQPLVVRPIEEEEGTYALLAGERRYRAILTLGWGEVPVVIKLNVNDYRAKVIEFIENKEREGLEWSEENKIKLQIHNEYIKNHGEEWRRKEENKEESKWDVKKTSKLLGEAYSTTSRDLKFAKECERRPDLYEIIKSLPLNVAIREFKRLEKSEGAKHKEIPEGDRITFSLGNALELIKEIPDKSIDLVITDPPFGIADLIRDRGKDSTQTYLKQLKVTDNLDHDTVINLITKIMPEIYRVLTPSAHIYMFCKIDLFETLRGIFTNNGIQPETRPLIWDKGRTTAPPKNYSYAPSWEPILFAHKLPRTKYMSSFSRDLVNFKTLPSDRKIHPFEKPKDLLAFLVKQSSDPGDTILDPFAGSGSTLRTAAEMNRKAIGFELDEGRYNVAKTEILGI